MGVDDVCNGKNLDACISFATDCTLCATANVSALSDKEANDVDDNADDDDDEAFAVVADD